MHEATVKRPLSISGDSSSTSATITSETTNTTSAGSSSQPFGLGLSMKAKSGVLRSDKLKSHVHGTVTPGGILESRKEPTAGKDLHMDLAGLGQMGDAASHASMIMQSRQAKLQRWRPNSSGAQVRVALKIVLMASLTGPEQPAIALAACFQSINHSRRPGYV
jgi:hypothetical protein